MESILFVCLGNICRSTIAEGIAREIAVQEGINLKIDSAGTGYWHVGETPCENSIKVCKNNGIDISNQRSREITILDKDEFNFIVAMDKENYDDLKEMGFKNIYKIGNYGGFKGKCVPDPYYFSGFNGFDKVYNMLDTAINDFIKTEGLLT
jgi:protein-tyrosine phosphatase